MTDGPSKYSLKYIYPSINQQIGLYDITSCPDLLFGTSNNSLIANCTAVPEKCAIKPRIGFLLDVYPLTCTIRLAAYIYTEKVDSDCSMIQPSLTFLMSAISNENPDTVCDRINPANLLFKYNYWLYMSPSGGTDQGLFKCHPINPYYFVDVGATGTGYLRFSITE